MNFDKISLTAKLTAYMRQYTDIPFAREVADQLRARDAFEKLLQAHALKPDDLAWYAPILEARYKSIAEMLRRSKTKQILELASGVSLRGLAMTQDPDLLYVETDLEDLNAEKISLISDISRQSNLTARENLHLIAANALDYRQLRTAAETFRSDCPITVVHEGLMQYLSADEMETVARNIRELLLEFGGTWITPDFSLKADADTVSEQQLHFRRIVATATDRKLYNNAFPDNDRLQAFFQELGFHIELFHQFDLAPHLTSMEVLQLPAQFLIDTGPRMRLWVLRLAH